MRKITSLLVSITVSLAVLGCGSSGGGSSNPGRIGGRADLSVTVEPNPIEARRVSGDTYDFPFTVLLRESNGVAVQIDRVNIDVTALGAITVYQESMTREQIAERGYATSLAGGGELRYSFTPRKEVDDDRLFGGVVAELRAEGTDASGNQISASTTVTVRR